MNEPEIRVVKDDATVAREAAERVTLLAGQSVSAGRNFTIALSGGSTPKVLYQLLAEEPYYSRINWDRFEVYFGDERCVPPSSPESNFHMADEALLSKAPIRPEHIHRMKGEIDPDAAAKEYGQMLKDRFGDGGLDLVLLGMGPDGHTASLFPGTAALQETSHRCVANFVPKLNTWRITMSAPFINRAANIIILVSGAAKRERLSEVLEGPRDPLRLPIQLIQPQGKLTWLVDAAAAGMDAE